MAREKKGNPKKRTEGSAAISSKNKEKREEGCNKFLQLPKALIVEILSRVLSIKTLLNCSWISLSAFTLYDRHLGFVVIVKGSQFLNNVLSSSSSISSTAEKEEDCLFVK
ncbi:hypothetical protein C1H46_014666 [Malus baccata]|uniref:F-box domain-containing protein n=1 Tax=Malus baccata TaxID=106549 RepID=A0A540MLS7_MALBA|nr:hypothetical protein C1H46_014666 [Malus baccata]